MTSTPPPRAAMKGHGMTESVQTQIDPTHDNGFVGLDPYDAIRAERGYQDHKWGGPNHDSQHSFEVWALILGREYGEALSAIGSILWPSDRAPNTSAWDRHMALRAELVQVAAVAVSIIEQMDPTPPGDGDHGADDDELEKRRTNGRHCITEMHGKA